MAGIICYLSVTKLKKAFAYDDSLDVFGVHGVGSITGMLLLGFLADPRVNPLIATTFKQNGQTLSLAGGWSQFGRQGVGVIFTVIFSGVATWALLKLVRFLVGLRISEDDESLGLDLSQHGENAYNE